MQEDIARRAKALLGKHKIWQTTASGPNMARLDARPWKQWMTRHQPALTDI